MYFTLSLTGQPAWVACASQSSVDAGSFATDGPEVTQAVQEVEALRLRPGASMTLSNLKTALNKGPEAGGEMKPSKHEQEVFGWPAQSNMLKGNPKEKIGCTY